MAVAFVRNHTSGSSTTSGTTLSFTLTNSVPAGNLLQVWVGFDNTATSTPTVSSIGKQSGEAGNWTKVASHDSSASGSAAGCRGEMWLIIPTVTWAAAAYTITLSEAVTSKAVVVAEFSGVSTALRGTAGSGTNTGGVPVAATGGTAPLTGDLVLGAMSCEGTSVATADTDTTNGTWSSINSSSASTGTASTSISVGAQYKIVTAGGSQTYNTAGGSDSGAVALALIPTSNGIWTWNGTNESPANVTVWNGSSEVASAPMVLGDYPIVVSSSTVGSNTSVVVPVPSGIANGDWLITFLAAQSATITAEYSIPSGWARTAWAFAAAEASRRYNAVFIHKVTDAGSEPASYTWSNAVTSRQAAVCVAVRYANATTPVTTNNGPSTETDPSLPKIPAIAAPSGITLILGMCHISAAAGINGTPVFGSPWTTVATATYPTPICTAANDVCWVGQTTTTSSGSVGNTVGSVPGGAASVDASAIIAVVK